MKYVRFTVVKLFLALPTVFGVTVLTFLLVHMIPGNPAQSLLGNQATPEQIARLTAELGLDRPLPEQYATFIAQLLHGDLGSSIFLQEQVSTLITERLPVTLSLLAAALLITLVLSVPLAGWAAMTPGSTVDRVTRVIPVIGLGMPNFWVGTMLILFFGLQLRLFPVGGWGTTPVERLHALVLPALTVALALSPILIRSLRASIGEVLSAEYIVTARAKGRDGIGLFGKHILRNASVPAVTVLSINLGYLIGGTVIIEQVFALPGIGQLMFMGVAQRDFSVVQGTTLFIALSVVVLGVLSDLVCALIDPRLLERKRS